MILEYSCPNCFSKSISEVLNVDGSSEDEKFNKCLKCGVVWMVSSKNEKSIKHDSEKPALQYVPYEAMVAMGQAFAYGAKKYGGNNYKISGLEVSRCLGAALRHTYAFLGGQNNDAESGHSHLGHAMAALAMALYMLENHPDKDDRFKK